MAARGRSKRSRPAEGGAKKGCGSAAGPGVDADAIALAHGRGDPPGGKRPPGPSADRRLETILRALSGKELDALIERVGIRVDPNKRIDKPAQVARALVRLPDVREPSRLPSASAELLRRVAEARGSLVVGTVPTGLDLLLGRGLIFARLADDELARRYRLEAGDKLGGAVLELVLPTAFLLQLRRGEGEDPRSLRALLAAAPFETASAIASHYLGRPSTPPISLALEPAWEVLGDREQLLAEIARSSHQERRLLDQLEEVGGEVDTQELMDFEREPMRVRGVYGVAAGRRGAAFSLEKRGFLFPLHPNRYVIPSEVALVVGAERRRQREVRRERIRSRVVAADHLPRRARFSVEPAAFALGLAMSVRDASGAMSAELKSGVGTPRSLLSRLAQRFGRSVDETALVIALSRAVGLWDVTAVSAAAPPGCLRLFELSRLLFDTWRRGCAWDEARSEPEMLRVPVEHRDPSPVGVLREMVLDALCDLGEGQWVPYRELWGYIAEDPRMGGWRRVLERWAKRVGVALPAEEALARRMLFESLSVLGAIDIGGAQLIAGEGDGWANGEWPGAALRLNARGRELIVTSGAEALRERNGEGGGSSSEMVERLLRVGSSARVAEVLELAPFVDVAAVEPLLELDLAAAAIARGLAWGIDAAEMQRRLELVAPVTGAVARSLAEAATVIGRASLVASGGFLWIDDPDVRELLRTRQGTAELFVDPSPQGGLLLAPSVEPDRVVRRCRALGVEVAVEEGGWRVRCSTVPPPIASETTRKTVSWRPPAIGSPPRGSAES